MKTKMLKIVAIVLMLAGSFYSCKEREESDGTVPYKPCSCEKELFTGLKFSQGEAYLFRDYIPEKMTKQINDEIYSAPFPLVCWIVYYSETDVADISFRSNSGGITYVGTICNFPDFAKEWIIPENGCKVNFEGRILESCNPFGVANAVYIDYVLIKFKIK